jgi:hypothetical protein
MVNNIKYVTLIPSTQKKNKTICALVRQIALVITHLIIIYKLILLRVLQAYGVYRFAVHFGA